MQREGKKRRRNPLSHLGWLGLLGVFGLLARAPALMVFLLFFFFFGYSGMPTDELFWQNVRRAGLRAFTVGAAGTGLLFASVTFYNVFFSHYRPDQWSADRTLVTLDGAYYDYLILLMGLLILVFVASVATFALTLAYFDRRERRYVEEETP